MFSVVGQAILCKFRHKTDILYYMPAGPNLVPVIRDIIMLVILRLFFHKTIFHFRAAGLSEFIQSRGSLFRRFAKAVYHAPDLAIHLSALNPDDGGYFEAKRKVVVRNGLEDEALPYLPIQRTPKDTIHILFVGIISESKGVHILLEAVHQLIASGHPVNLTVVGDFASEQFKNKALSYCRQHAIEKQVHWVGVKKGEEKWRYFLEADIFCFPSFYESESFGNVAVEAMMFQLPVVATRWRGIPDIVEDGKTGLLVPIKDADKTAEALRTFIEDESLRMSMGKAGRNRYLEYFRLENFLSNMQQAFQQVSHT